MKRIKEKALPIVAVLALVVGLLPGTAFAAELSNSNDAGSTKVTYTGTAIVEEYTVVIPESINLNEESSMSFLCTKNTMQHTIRLMLDTEKSCSSDGNLYLTNSSGSDIIRYEMYSPDGGTYIPENSAQLACWRGGETTPTAGGYVELSVVGTALTSEEYTGTLYFTITVDTD